MNFPYVIKLLNEKLKEEEKFLVRWKKNLEVGDAASKRQAEGNIPSNEHRIKELTEAINKLQNV